MQLAMDMKTGNEVAVKFIKRGPNMQTKSILRCERRRVPKDGSNRMRHTVDQPVF